MVHQIHTGGFSHKDQINELNKEIDDVVTKLEYIKTTHWGKQYKKRVRKVKRGRAGRVLRGRLRRFQKSKLGNQLNQQVAELKQALKEEVTVTDLPKTWRKGANMVSEEEMSMLQDELDDIEYELAEQNNMYLY